MPRIQSGFDRGFDVGSQIGQARRRRISEQREERRYQEELELARQQEGAAREADQMRIGDLERREVGRLQRQGVQDAAEEGFGPRALAEGQAPALQAQARFERIRSVAGRLSEKNRARFIQDQGQQLRSEAIERASHQVADQIQDRMAGGGYNFHGDKDISPEVEGRLQQVMEAMESGQIGPMQAAQLEEKIVESVRNTNRQRLMKERGTKVIDEELTKAVGMGNGVYADDLELLHSLWGVGDLDYDDLVDRMFEAKHGRKTSRASGPSPHEVRKEAIALWNRHNEGPPSEAELVQMEALVSPDREQLDRAATSQGLPYREGETAETTGLSGSDLEFRQREAGEREALRGRVGGRNGRKVPRGASAGEGEAGPPRAFKSVSKKDQRDLKFALSRDVRTLEDVQAVFDAFNIDPTSLDEATVRALVLKGDLQGVLGAGR